MAIDESYIIRLKAEVDGYIKDVQKAGQVTTATQKGIETSFNKVTQAMQKNNKAIAISGRNLGMLGIQFEQLANQVGGGVSFLRAFSVQAADIGFLIGAPLAGAIIGTAAALTSIFIPALLDSGKATEELTQKLKDLEKQGKLTTNQELALAQLTAKEVEETKKRITEIENEIKSNQKLIDSRENGVGRSAESLRKGSKKLEEQNVLLRAEQDLLNQSLKDGNEISKEAIRLQASLTNELEARQAAETVRDFSLGQGESIDVANAKAETRMILAEEIQRYDAQRELLVSNNQSIEELEEVHQMRLLDIRQIGADKVDAINQKSINNRIRQEQAFNSIALSGAVSLISSLGSIAANGEKDEKKRFEINKKVQAANTIINTASGAMKAFQQLGAFGGPAAGVIIAAGAAQLAAINSTSYGGGGSVASTGSASAASTSTTEQEEAPTVSVSETDIATGQSSTVILRLDNDTDLATGILEGTEQANNDGRGDLF